MANRHSREKPGHPPGFFVSTHLHQPQPLHATQPLQPETLRRRGPRALPRGPAPPDTHDPPRRRLVTRSPHGRSLPRRRSQRDPDEPANVTQWQRGPAWKCSDKQKDLILKLVEEHQLDKADVEALAIERFGKGVRTLNKVEASGLIDELLDTYGGSKHQGNHSGSTRRNGSAYSGAHGRRAAA